MLIKNGTVDGVNSLGNFPSTTNGYTTSFDDEPDYFEHTSPYSTSNFYPEDFVQSLEKSIKTSISEKSSGALLIIQINNLPMIINAYGHDTSEIVLHDLTREIRAIVSEDDDIKRLQRDQLGIILKNSYPEETAKIAGRLHNLIQNFGRDDFATSSLYVVGVIGSVNFPLETADVHDALDKAYIAVGSVQNTSQRTYESTKHEGDLCRQQMGLANFLFKAVKDNRLRMAYQPVIDAKTGQILHYEALLRIVSTSGKISSAGALIPVAEKMGLIDVIDNLVMNLIIDEVRRSPNVSIAFNVSNMTTENLVWLDSFTKKIKETPDIAPRLIVEITETAAQRDLRSAAYFVASLQALGCQVALDDFGSGYTSFRQLKALSVDMVKIDGSFIKDLDGNSDNQFFVKILLDFAQGFGLKTVAEFVENGEVAKILMGMGVDYLQGYYLGKPENHRSWVDGGEYSKE